MRTAGLRVCPRDFRANANMSTKLKFQIRCGHRRFQVLKRALILLVFIIAASGAVHAQDDGYYTITGRVVDRDGNGFADAGICLEPGVYESKAFDRFVECIGTDPDGRFAFKRTKDESTTGKDYFLFVSVDNSDGLSTMTPPFDLVRRFDKSFDGKLVKLGSQDVIDLGDVGVQFWYGAAALTFSPRSKESVDWPNAWVRILNKNGNVVHLASLSREDVRKCVKNDGSRLDVALPEGRWKVEILTSPDSRGPVAYTPYFDIKRDAKHNATLKFKQ